MPLPTLKTDPDFWKGYGLPVFKEEEKIRGCVPGHSDQDRTATDTREGDSMKLGVGWCISPTKYFTHTRDGVSLSEGIHPYTPSDVNTGSPAIFWIAVFDTKVGVI